ncbi:hypothetical protein R3P38DRAFT_3561911 [Favolaschia claudopus]|uniref:Reverse transcriptase n=1 Tax=Favolaschia claudopus TaxID=2862362 RepID=A0AAW0AUS7_9AGAR
MLFWLFYGFLDLPLAESDSDFETFFSSLRSSIFPLSPEHRLFSTSSPHTPQNNLNHSDVVHGAPLENLRAPSSLDWQLGFDSLVRAALKTCNFLSRRNTRLSNDHPFLLLATSAWILNKLSSSLHSSIFQVPLHPIQSKLSTIYDILNLPPIPTNINRTSCAAHCQAIIPLS